MNIIKSKRLYHWDWNPLNFFSNYKIVCFSKLIDDVQNRDKKWSRKKDNSSNNYENDWGYENLSIINYNSLLKSYYSSEPQKNIKIFSRKPLNQKMISMKPKRNMKKILTYLILLMVNFSKEIKSKPLLIIFYFSYGNYRFVEIATWTKIERKTKWFVFSGFFTQCTNNFF